MSAEVTIRPWDPAAEDGLIYSSWLKSLRHDVMHRNVDARHVRDSVWFTGQRRIIDEVLAQPDTSVNVAELEGVIVGWVCAGPEAIHYAYVKDAYRGHGVYLALVGSAEAPAVSCLTTPVLRWMRKGHRYEYVPVDFLLRQPE